MKWIIFLILNTFYSSYAIADSIVTIHPAWFKYLQDAYTNTDATILFTLKEINVIPSEDDDPGWHTVKKVGKIKKVYNSNEKFDGDIFEFITTIETNPEFDQSQLPQDYIVNLCFEGDRWTGGGFGTFNQANPDLTAAIKKISQTVKITSEDKRIWCQ
ncbi:hypothetical protein L4C36_23025 [Photobacterium japonica]|uniref:hypothetical protein n=1 Tax=Photobacterium japonica TaxID=2910235 RepID=UPI003D0DC854